MVWDDARGALPCGALGAFGRPADRPPRSTALTPLSPITLRAQNPTYRTMIYRVILALLIAKAAGFASHPDHHHDDGHMMDARGEAGRGAGREVGKGEGERERGTRDARLVAHSERSPLELSCVAAALSGW